LRSTADSVYSSILLNILRIGHLLSVGVDGSSDAILVTHRASPSDGFDAQFRRQMILAVLVLEFHLIVEQSEDRSHVFLEEPVTRSARHHGRDVLHASEDGLPWNVIRFVFQVARQVQGRFIIQLSGLDQIQGVVNYLCSMDDGNDRVIFISCCVINCQLSKS